MSHAQPAGRGRNRPALRLVETKSLSRDEWLEVEKTVSAARMQPLLWA